MAVTHTEVYRTFAGRATHRRFRYLPLAGSGIRIGVKKKLPLLLLYIPAGIATIVHCFMVYLAFRVREQNIVPTSPTDLIAIGLASSIASQLLEVRGIIGQFNQVTTYFGLLIMAWYGAGLIAEDKRLGAHLLYFSRPINRLDYVLGKIGTVGFFGACASLVPGLIICTIAAFTSPDWTFLTHQADTIAYTCGFALLWITLVCSAVLAISSVMPRKTFSLIGIVAVFFMAGPPVEIMIEVTREDIWGVFSPFRCMDELRFWFFNSRDMAEDWIDVRPYFISVATMILVCWSILAFRVRRLEVVA